MELKIVNWIREYCIDNKIKCLVVGISGGIDSALVSTLCAMTGFKTIVVSLPIHQDESQLNRASNHVIWLQSKFDNVEFVEKNISEIFDNFKSIFENSDDLSLANTRSRLRMTSLYHISSINGGIVVGTGNKIEDFGIGFFTKYGDGGVDISPIADLTKTEVRELSKKLEIDKEILLAKPTDGLWDDGRCDEDQIGATYEELEFAMNFYDDPSFLNNRQIEVLGIYNDLNQKNKHKMIPIPIFKKNGSN